MPVTITSAKVPAPKMRRKFSADKFEMYGRMKLSQNAIAGLERASNHTIQKALNIPELREAYEFGKAETISAIRKKQLTTALNGNVQMLIHVGHHFADQDQPPNMHGLHDVTPDQFTWDSKSRERFEELRELFKDDPIDADFTDVTDAGDGDHGDY